jgi:Protein of unknown function (DUF1302)
MKRYRRITLLLLLFLFPLFIFGGDLSFDGFVRTYLGVKTSDEFDFTVVQNAFDLTMEYSSSRAAFLVNPVINYDTDNSLTFDVRELYMDLYLDNSEFRVGRQQVVWGKSDGVFITDVVSPLNLEEFLLPDFEEIRMGVTALKADYYLGNSTMELIWIPVFTPNTMAGPDSIWNPTGMDFSGSSDSIDFTMANSEIFGRFSLFSSYIDFELVGGYLWDDMATVSQEPAGTPPYTLDHNRLGMAGGSFSTALGGFIFRGEGAYYNGKYYQDTASPTAPVKKDYLHYMGGLDYTIGGWFLSTQFIQQIILDYDESLVNDQFGNTMTFLIRKSFLRETLFFDFFTYFEINNPNALIRPKVTYNLADGLEILLGYNYFVGDSGGIFGQHSENNMLYTKLKFSF